jgi:hypothetical protein
LLGGAETTRRPGGKDDGCGVAHLATLPRRGPTPTVDYLGFLPEANRYQPIAHS